MDDQIQRIRRATIKSVASHLDAAGVRLAGEGVVGAEVLASETSEGGRDRSIAALGLLTRITAELAGVSGGLLGGKHRYAGAALLRQVVEIEYLTWAFANGERDADRWLNSTREERREFFAPWKLRKLSDGRFENNDYMYHCEQGGHPVPGASDLIGQGSEAPAQILLVDLLLHSWRITDNVIRCVQGLDGEYGAATEALRRSQRALAAWGEQDPYYRYLRSTAPESPVQ